MPHSRNHPMNGPIGNRQSAMDTPARGLLRSSSCPTVAKRPPRALTPQVLDGPSRAPGRAMLHAVGFTREDFAQDAGRRLLGLEPGDAVQHAPRRTGGTGVGRRDRAGGKAVAFGTITVSDGISMGTEGMKYSLVSREVIADSLETVAGAEGFDGLVAIGGCDKNMPGMVIGLARLNRPSVFVYGGTILPGHLAGTAGGHRLGLRGRRQARRRPDDRRGAGRSRVARVPRRRLVRRHVHRQHDGLGHRGARAQPAEQLGAGRGLAARSWPTPSAPAPRWSSWSPRNLRPRDILTRRAFENAITTVIALGGSTNAVLHLLAMAHAANVRLTIDDFTRDRPQGAGTGRPQAERPLRHGGAGEDRRAHAAPEALAGRAACSTGTP